MKINKDNVYAHELIGLDVVVEDSKDPTLKGLNGKIVFESKNMLYIRINAEDCRIKAVPKGIARLLFILPDKSRCIVEGKDLIGRPEDRIERIERRMITYGRR
ncbi:MAG: ribonuclease P protein component 1 [Candidatus Nitrosocaldus sp.]